MSLTHGNSPRQHVWTFATSPTEDEASNSNLNDACLCAITTSTFNVDIPPFVGEDYFCESAVNSGNPTGGQFYPDDPVWDRLGCSSSSKCCSFNTPPYFIKQLPAATTDDIEARICQYDINDDSPIELIELYVQ